MIKLNEKQKRNVCIFMFFALMAEVLYGNFLSGQEFFLLDDDSYRQTYPTLVYWANCIKQGYIPEWSFSVGMGQNLPAQMLDVFNFIVALAGPAHVAYMMGVMQCVKVVLAGCFFYLYIQELGFDYKIAWVISTGYAFCGHMIGFGWYKSYPNEVVCVAILLWILEKCIKKQKYAMLLFPFSFLVINLRIYYAVLYAGIVVVYSLVRFYMIDSRHRIRGIMKELGAIIISCGISAFAWLPNFISVLNSERINSVVSGGIIQNTDMIINGTLLKEAFMRVLSPNIYGQFENYLGTGNYVDSPCFYCGILCVVVCPVAILVKNKRQRNGLIVMLAGAAIYIMFPKVVYLLNAFSKDTYKLSSLWISIVILVCAAYGLRELFDLNIWGTWIARGISLISIGILLYYWKLQKNNMDNMNASLCILFLAIYLIIFIMKNPTQKWAEREKNILLAVFCVEVLCISSKAVYGRETVSYDIINSEGYHDGTETVVEELKTDEREFGRIGKTYLSVRYCDALAQNYFGTTSYQGGANVSAKSYNFYKELDLALSDNDSRFMQGFEGHPEINALMNVKYYLAKQNGEFIDYGYTYKNTSQDILVYENELAIPFGSVYTNTISKDQFDKLSYREKKNALLSNIVLDEEKDNTRKDFDRVEKLIKENSIAKYMDIEFDQPYAVNESGRDMVVLTIDADIDAAIEKDRGVLEGATAYVCWYNSEKDEWNFRNINFYNGQKQYSVEICDENVSAFLIGLNKGEGKINISSVDVAAVNKEEYYSYFEESIHRLNENHMNIEYFRDDYISGYINSTVEGYMFFPIPYDEGWECYIDDEMKPLECADIGFLSVKVGEGNHTVLLKYNAPGKKVADGISGGLLLIVLAYFILRKWFDRKALMYGKKKLKREGHIWDAIEFLKGIAIIMIICVHVPQPIEGINDYVRKISEYGRMGCQLFFVLSGFSLMYTWKKQKLSYFYRRKYMRLAKPYWVMIIIYLTLNLLNQNVLNWNPVLKVSTDIKGIVVNALLLNGLSVNFNNNIVPGGWFVGTMLILYLLFPFIAWFLEKINGNKPVCIIIAIVVAALSCIGAEGIVAIIGNESFAYNSFINQITPFFLGTIIGYLYKAGKLKQKTWLYTIVSIIGFGTGLYIYYSDRFSQFRMLRTLKVISVSIGFTALLCLAISLYRKFKIKDSFIRTMGRNSYEIFFLHILLAFYVLPYALSYISINVNGNVLLVGSLLFVLAFSYTFARIKEYFAMKRNMY